MNKENAIKKINTMGKVGHIVCIVLEAIIGAGAFLTLLAIIAMLILPKDFFKMTTTTEIISEINLSKFIDGANNKQAFIDGIEKDLNEGSISIKEGSFTLTGSDLNFDSNTGTISVDMAAQTGEITSRSLCGVLLLAIAAMAAAFVAILFVGKLCKSIKKCESPFEDEVINKMRFLGFSLIPWAALSSIQGAILTTLFGGKSLNFSLDLTTVFIILIIFALSFIFKYGAVLQKESDETI